jgi:phosphonate transport system substrate-binding protein
MKRGNDNGEMRSMLGIGLVLLALLLALTGCPASNSNSAIKVVLIPADGGTASGTLADYKPLFATLTESTGMTFDLSVTQSYSAAVEALCSGSADVAFVGPAAYLQAHQRGCADLLAVGVRGGKSLYYSGIFVPETSKLRTLADLKGQRVAFGDINSTSSFLMPIAMMIGAGVNPERDLAAVQLTGSHPNSLAALRAGEVDAAALSFDSFDRALRANVPGVENFRVLARSTPMPYPPFVVSTRLPSEQQDRLRKGFAKLSARDLTGYAGRKLDSYTSAVDQSPFDRLAAALAPVTAERKAAILRRAGGR